LRSEARAFDQLASLDKPWPARHRVASRERPLRIGELRVLHRDFIGMILLEFRNRVGIAATRVAKKCLGLALELLKVGTYRAMAVC
jgi:hypothetical protein